jgi:SynChlorMet cassette protein ScmC
MSLRLYCRWDLQQKVWGILDALPMEPQDVPLLDHGIVLHPDQIQMINKAESLKQGEFFKSQGGAKITVDTRAGKQKSPTFGIRLGNVCTWGIISQDETAEEIVALLADAMDLLPIDPYCCHRLIFVSHQNATSNGFNNIPNGRQFIKISVQSYQKIFVGFNVSPADSAGALALTEMGKALSFLLGLLSQSDGGLLIHGALVERNGNGVLMAGRSKVGKTTASGRLPLSWHSLCDDVTLIVRDDLGGYWVHPWPTWSKFRGNGSGGRWMVERAIPLKGIFVLEQGVDEASALGCGQAVCLLSECAKQVTDYLIKELNLSEEEVSAYNLQRFENVCALAKAVPSYQLRLSLNGSFWMEIETALNAVAGEISNSSRNI